MSIFSQPLGRAAVGAYAGVGAGAGAALAGRDQRTAGAVAGGVTGAVVGGGAHAFAGNAKRAWGGLRAGANWARGESQAGRRVAAAGSVLSDAAKRITMNPNISAGLSSDISRAGSGVTRGINAVRNMMSRFHR